MDFCLIFSSMWASMQCLKQPARAVVPKGNRYDMLDGKTISGVGHVVEPPLMSGSDFNDFRGTASAFQFLACVRLVEDTHAFQKHY
eukprot:3048450-Amphidinium_carterae.3